MRCLFLSLLILPLMAQNFAPIERRIPPMGTLPPPEVVQQLEADAALLSASEDPDILIFSKAVTFALRHQEFYKKDDAKVAAAVVEEGKRRLADKERSWTQARGRLVRGYVSEIDGSAQAYGLEIPEDLDLSKPVPLYVWLHGRGDKTTDMHFIHQRMTRGGKIQRPKAIVVHPFGRHCMGFKHAGEIDVLDVVEEVKEHYKIDTDRIVLMGFSMGGAGVWHIAAHYPEPWAAMSPGAGFAETAQYIKLKPADFPPAYEQTLWRTYDVPNYTRNLFNLPAFAYSGEDDKQIQAARVMEAAYQSEGQILPHLIGPKTGHKYHPDTLVELLGKIEASLPRKTGERGTLQTQTLRYNRAGGLEVLALNQHWKDSRIDWDAKTVTTRNVSSFRFADGKQRKVEIDGTSVSGNAFHLDDGTWKTGADLQGKRPGLQGPIDDAFLRPFVVVPPQKKEDETSAWMDFELEHLNARWRALFRGELPMDEVGTISTRDERNLVLFGTPETNPWIAMLVEHLPISWDAKTLVVNGKTYDARSHVPALIYPNPMVKGRYIVLNSGPTFREGHDRTNSLQNPKLPDWAVLNIETAPTSLAAGKVIEAGFFDENWQFPQP